MNLNKIRKDYSSLTMLERLSLVDNAIARDDESEIRAIVAASPRKQFSQVDYLDLLNEINKFRFCNLIVRLSYITQFDYFCTESELEFLKNKSSSKREERLDIDARMSAFLYVRATDAWKSVCDEFGFRPDFDNNVSAFLYSVEMMKRKEEILRKMAFTEDEVKEQLKKLTGIDTIKTLAEEIISIKEVLGLPQNKT